MNTNPLAVDIGREGFHLVFKYPVPVPPAVTSNVLMRWAAREKFGSSG